MDLEPERSGSPERGWCLEFTRLAQYGQATRAFGGDRSTRVTTNLAQEATWVLIPSASSCLR